MNTGHPNIFHKSNDKVVTTWLHYDDGKVLSIYIHHSTAMH